MSKFLIQASYTAEGARGLLAEGGTKRRETVEELIDKLGGSLEAFYYAFGDDDVVIIVDVPDTATMTAFSLTIAASGAVTTKSTVLISPEEVDAAGGIAVNYRPPGA